MFAWKRQWRKDRESDRTVTTVEVRGPDAALARAIAADEITILFQPQIVPATGRIVAVEALARWAGEPRPEQLFARAERAGLAERLSRHIQRKAIQTVAGWAGPMAELRLSLNLLPQDVARPGFERWLLAQLGEAELPPARLTMEITEGSLVDDRIAASARLAQLRAAGVRIAIDDFGTGYSSLAYLSSLPLDTIKIDRGLIRDIVGGSRDRIVVKAMIRLARELNLSVVVEGVESEAQLGLLAEWGCDLYQGFLGAVPLSEEELLFFIEAGRAEAACAA
ncbi:EAL domain-containing protein [Sphingomonas ginkgonis]|uniref:EAL domain-containing protein n=1 Tax=Sphingomonas ginkgonis TaxID=2315330 RepID=A0A429VB76_9SPHN|nr:EAL domain-containing protein [Sphingomonas ginkgonis]RST31220.1 EAL domain-containing protein [Sphingomonas ginkgonis]